MVTAFVQFKIPAPLSREQPKEIFMSTAPKYQQALGFDVPGKLLIGLGTK